jgi:hypothetical protein
MPIPSGVGISALRRSCLSFDVAKGAQVVLSVNAGNKKLWRKYYLSGADHALADTLGWQFTT